MGLPLKYHPTPIIYSARQLSSWKLSHLNAFGGLRRSSSYSFIRAPHGIRGNELSEILEFSKKDSKLATQESAIFCFNFCLELILNFQ